MKNTNAHLSQGFSLIELLVSVFVASLVGIAVGTFAMNIFSFNTFVASSLSASSEANMALKNMTREIRPLSPSSLGAYPIATADATTFTFYSDINGNGLKEEVRYFLSGDTLEKGVTEPSGSPLTYNAANEKIYQVAHYLVNGATPIFEYYDSSYDGTTAALVSPVDISTVRLVKITIIVDNDPNRSPSPQTLTTQIMMRNLKDNL